MTPDTQMILVVALVSLLAYLVGWYRGRCWEAHEMDGECDVSVEALHITMRNEIEWLRSQLNEQIDGPPSSSREAVQQ